VQGRIPAFGWFVPLEPAGNSLAQINDYLPALQDQHNSAYRYTTRYIKTPPSGGVFIFKN